MSAATTWNEWLGKQSEEVQRDVLGATRYEMYKKGTSTGSFVSDGRILILEQLIAKEELTLYGAGLKDKSIDEQDKYSDMYYESIRNRNEPTDIGKIAKYAAEHGFTYRAPLKTIF